MSIASIFHAVTHSVHEFLVRIFGQSALDKVDADVKQVLSDDFLPIFKEAIEEAGKLPGEGADKRTAAFQKIVAELAAAGKSLPMQVVNLGIELVYGLLKAKSV